MTSFDARVIGPGRAGGALALALRGAGWSVDGPLGHDHDAVSVAEDTRALVLAVPDGAVRAVARAVAPGEAVVVHLAGALGLDALDGHDRVASLHPLVSLADPERGADQLVGAWFAVAGDPIAVEIATALGGRTVEVADENRVAYHAAASMAANHLVALLGQVDRVTSRIGVPLEAYLDLARGALDNVAAVGPAAALTGPVARGDWDTVDRHLAALDPVERPAYATLADAARRLLAETA